MSDGGWGISMPYEQQQQEMFNHNTGTSYADALLKTFRSWGSNRLSREREQIEIDRTRKRLIAQWEMWNEQRKNSTDPEWLQRINAKSSITPEEKMRKDWYLSGNEYLKRRADEGYLF